MALIRSIDNFSNLLKYYKVPDVTNEEDAVRWLNNVRYLSGIVVSYISLEDLLNRSDEGSESIEFNNEISFEDLKNAIHERSFISVISITGTYFNKPIVVGVDLRGYDEFITIRKKNAANIKALETALGLV